MTSVSWLPPNDDGGGALRRCIVARPLPPRRLYLPRPVLTVIPVVVVPAAVVAGFRLAVAVAPLAVFVSLVSPALAAVVVVVAAVLVFDADDAVGLFWVGAVWWDGVSCVGFGVSAFLLE